MTPFGAYVHIPFCAHRCDYCAFATWTDRGHLVSHYLTAVGREIDVAKRKGFRAHERLLRRRYTVARSGQR